MTLRSVSTFAAIAAALSLAACKPATPPEQPTAATTATAASTATPAPAAEPVAPAASDVIGTFAGTLPCADCPGINTTLVISEDGTYTLAEAYQERQDKAVSDGKWTLGADGKTLHLVPTAGDGDRYYQSVSADELRMLDADGKPVDSPLNYSLHRR